MSAKRARGIEKTPTLEQIPDIEKPSIDGLVEIGRGCCRGCQFCSVTTRPLRWYPYEKILREIDVNRKAEIKQVCLHSEDVMLYGSKNTTPDEEKLIRLHELVLKDCSGFSWSHCSLAAVASKPRTFSNIAEVILQKQDWWGAEVGIETGSSELAKKMMPAKAHPFKADNWPDVVCTGMGLMHDNRMIPACTLIVGAPEETEEDVNKTIELMDDLKPVRSLVVPLFFVPMGKLRNEDWFKEAYMTELHKELLLKCLEHDFYWIDDLIRLSFSRTWYAVPLQFFYRIFARIAKWSARAKLIDMSTKDTKRVML